MANVAQGAIDRASQFGVKCTDIHVVRWHRKMVTSLDNSPGIDLGLSGPNNER